jgi:curved DNA-binding protein CbpA
MKSRQTCGSVGFQKKHSICRTKVTTTEPFPVKGRRNRASSSVRALNLVALASVLMLVSRTAHALRGQDEDWYKVLGVERSADSKVIRTAYRKLVLKWHPDKNPGKEAEAGKQTSRLNNAYEILMNSVERRDFDERFFGASQRVSPPPEEAASPPSAQHVPTGKGPASMPDENTPQAGGVDQEDSAERKSTFDPRRPGRSWRSWGRTGAAASQARTAYAATRSFEDDAWEQAQRTVENIFYMPNPLDAKHCKTPQARAAREGRQRDKADKFEGYRNKQQKRAAKRELRQRASARGEREKREREQERERQRAAADNTAHTRNTPHTPHPEAAGDVPHAAQGFAHMPHMPFEPPDYFAAPSPDTRERREQERERDSAAADNPARMPREPADHFAEESRDTSYHDAPRKSQDSFFAKAKAKFDPLDPRSWPSAQKTKRKMRQELRRERESESRRDGSWRRQRAIPAGGLRRSSIPGEIPVTNGCCWC